MIDKKKNTYDFETSLYQLFKKQVDKQPNTEAVNFVKDNCEKVQLTYKELSDLIDQVAEYLYLNVKAGQTRIGVFLNRSHLSLITILAIWKNGFVYVPIDKSFPKAYIRLILDDADVDLVLGEGKFESNIQGRTFVDLEDILYGDNQVVEYSHTDKSNSENLSFIMYTSGTTGTPKGVAHKQHQLINRFNWTWETYDFSETDIFIQRTNVNFMPSMWEFLGGLLIGCKTVIIDDSISKDLYKLSNCIKTENINVVLFVPSMLEKFLDIIEFENQKPKIKFCILCGELLKPSLFKRAMKILSNTIFLNDYGSTEMNGVLYYDNLDLEQTLLDNPTFAPISNIDVYILDEHGQEVKEGNLYIGGISLALNYVNLEEENKAKFIDKIINGKKIRIYKTGDIARYNNQGRISILGRKDNQVKINGIRIELELVEQGIKELEEVEEVCVIAQEIAESNKTLIAFISGKNLSQEKLVLRLKEILPYYMIPKRYIFLDSLPRLSNGKIDKKKLSLSMDNEEIDKKQSYLSNITQKVAEILSLEPQNIDVNSSFDSIGFDSLNIVDFLNYLRKEYNSILNVSEIFDYFTIEKIVTFLLDKKASERNPEETPQISNGDLLDIAIVGMAIKFPSINNLDDFWKTISNGEYIAHSFPTKNNGLNISSSLVEDVDKIDLSDFKINPRESRLMDPSQKIILDNVKKAISDSGYTIDQLRNKKTGIFIGARKSDYTIDYNQVSESDKAFAYMGSDPSILASRLSYSLNLSGPALIVDTACSSSLMAIHLAYRGLQTGDCDVAIVGGINIMNTNQLYKESMALGILSPRQEISPFDDSADGTVINEGVGVIILTNIQEAEKLALNIYGSIVGTATNQDGKTNGITAPSGNAQEKLMLEVLKNSNVTPDSVDYVECHGTATKLGDPIELQTIYKTFSSTAKKAVAIGTVKSNIGHTVACSGISSLIKVMLSMKHFVMPKVVGFKTLNEHVKHLNDFFKINTENKAWNNPQYTVINSFGFSGTNVSIVVKAYHKNEESESPVEKAVQESLIDLPDNLYQLTQHKVSNVPTLSGASQLAYIVNYSDKKRKIAMQDIVWPAKLKVYEPTVLKIIVDSSGVFKLKSSQEPICKGKIIDYSIPINEVNEDMLEVDWKDNSSDFYDYLRESGVDYGYYYQLVINIAKMSKNYYWTILDLSKLKSFSEDQSPYLLDAVFHSVMTHSFFENLSISSPYIPFTIEELVFDFNLLTDKIYVKVDIIRCLNYSEKEILQANLTIYNFEGQKIGFIRNFMLLRKLQASLTKVTYCKYHEAAYEFKDNEIVSVKRILWIGPKVEDICFELIEYPSIQELVANIEFAFEQLVNEQEITIVYNMGSISNATILQEQDNHYISNIYNIFKLLVKRKVKTTKLRFVCLYFYKEENPQVPLRGFFESLSLELDYLDYKILGIECKKIDKDKLINKEISFDFSEKVVVYDSNSRKVIRLEELNILEKVQKIKGVYLIAGGLGGVGKYICQALLKNSDTEVIILGRSSLESKLEALQALNNTAVEYIQVDTTDMKAMSEKFVYIKKKYGQINGVIQSVGQAHDSLFFNKEPAQISEVYKTKVETTKILDQLTAKESLDFFTVFSSISSYFGNVGQSDYAFSNGLLETFSLWRNQLVQKGERKGNTTAILWPYWEDGGMVMSDKLLKKEIEKNGLLPISSDEGTKAFSKIISNISGNVLVLKKGKDLFMKDEVNKPKMVDISEDALSACLKHVISEVTEINPRKITNDTYFDELGLNSFLIMEIIDKLEFFFGRLTKTLFFENTNFKELKQYFLTQIDYSEIDTDFLIPFSESRLTDGVETNSISIAPNVEEESSRTLATDSPVTVNEEKRIVITGLAGKYPGADSLNEFWNNLAQGKDSVTLGRDTKNKQLEKAFSGKYGGFIQNIEEFDPLFFNISPKEAELMDPQERKFLEIAYHAIQDAGYTMEFLSEKKVGVYVGAMWGHYQLYGKQADKELPNSNFASIANRVSYFFNFKGPSLTFDSMCSSSISALKYACDDLNSGQVDYAIVGGVNIITHPMKYTHLIQGDFYSKEGKCRSFGENGEGYVPGEGIGAVFLKRYNDTRYEENSYGSILGVGLQHGGKTSGYTVPSPVSQSCLIKDTLERLSVHPEQINYIEAHGTGTSLGDPIEIDGLKKSFNNWTNKKQFCPIGSVKSNIGHLESAAGMASLTKVLLQLQHQKLVPSIHADTLNSNIDFENSPVFVQRELSEWNSNKKLASISGFGAGGSNGYVLIEEPPNEIRPVVNKEDFAFPLALITGKDKTSMIENCKALYKFLSNHQVSTYSLNELIEDIAFHFSVDSKFINKSVEIGQYFPTISEYIEFINVLKNQTKKEISIDEADREKTIEEFFVQYFQEYDGYHTNAQFENILYTLQAHRDHFNYRTAIFCENITQLQQELFTIINEQHSENIFYGKVEEIKTEKPAISSKTDYKTVANLWIQGTSFQWENFYEAMDLQKVSLPNYVFKKESYWIAKVEEKESEDMSLNNMVVYLNPENKLLSEHKVNGQIVVPGAFLIQQLVEMVRSSYNKNFSIEEIRFMKPIILTKEEEIEFIFELRETTLFFKIELLGNKELIAQGMLHAESSQQSTSNSIKNLDFAAVSFNRDKKEFYQSFNHKGIVYGESYKLITGSAEIENGILIEHKDYGLQKNKIPANRLDSIFQSLGNFFISSKETYLPYMIKELTFISNQLPEHFYTMVKQNNDGTFRVISFDEEGGILLQLNQLMMKPVRNKAANSDTAFYVKETKMPVSLDSDSEEFTEKIIVLDEIWLQDVKEIFSKATIATDLINSQEYRKLKIIKNIHFDEMYLKKNIWTIWFDMKEFLLQCEKLAGKKEIYLFVELEGNLSIIKSLLGLLKSFLLETTNMKFRIVALDRFQELNRKILGYIIEDLEYIILEEKQYFQHKYEETATRKNQTITINCNDTILVCGGSGYLGEQTVKFLNKKTGCRTIVLGRSDMEKTQQELLKSYNSFYERCDVSDEQVLEQILPAITEKYGNITGVINCAGVIRDKLLKNKLDDEMSEVIKAKVNTTINLDRYFKDAQLKFFVVFSSIASVIGNIGQTDYAFANGFLDDYVSYRNQLVAVGERFGKTIGINWPMWQGQGMSVTKDTMEQIQKQTGLTSLSEEKGLEEFNEILLTNQGQIIYSIGNKEKILEYLNRFLLNEKQSIKEVVGVKEDMKEIQEILFEIVNEVTKVPVERINKNDDFQNYGIDSVMLLEMEALLEEKISLTIKNVFVKSSSIEEALQLIKESDVIRKTEIKSTKLSKPAVVEAGKYKEESKLDELVVIGKNFKFPGAENTVELLEKLRHEQTVIQQIPNKDYYGNFISDVDSFDPLFFNISPKKAKYLTPEERLTLTSVWKALEDAGYNKDDFQEMKKQGKQVGVFSVAMYQEYKDITVNIKEQRLIGNGTQWSLPNRISYFLDIFGPSLFINTACSSAVTAIELAKQSIHSGTCELAIITGCNLNLSMNKFNELDDNYLLQKHFTSQSFSAEGEGYIPSEGVATIILTNKKQAVAHNDRMYCEILAAKTMHSGNTEAFKVPSNEQINHLLKATIAESRLKISDISYIESAANGLKKGDAAEFKAISQLSENTEGFDYCAIGTIKSTFGHMEAVSGLSQLIKVILQLDRKELYPSLKFVEHVNEEIQLENTPLEIVSEVKPWQTNQSKRVALINSIGAGGSIGCLIVREVNDAVNYVEEIKAKQLYLFSAQTQASLANYLIKFETELNATATVNYQDLAYTLSRREQFLQRVAIIADSRENLSEKLVKKAYLSNSKLSNQDQLSELEQTAKHWLEGNKIAKEKLNKLFTGSITDIPNYSFEEASYWLTDKSENDLHFMWLAKKELAVEDSVAVEKSEIETELKQILFSIIAKITGVDVKNIDLSSNIKKFGMDSLDYAKMIDMIEAEIAVKLQIKEIFPMKDIYEILKKIYSEKIEHSANQKNKDFLIITGIENNLFSVEEACSIRENTM